MIGDLSKRFWQNVSVEKSADGFGIMLDNRKLTTPAKEQLIVPTKELAKLIAAEWDAQTDKIDPQSLPFTRMANAAIDKVRIQKAEVAQLLLDYGDSDLLCYRAEFPTTLVSRQIEAWDPLLKWAFNEFGVVLKPRTGVIHQAQSPEDLAILGNVVHTYSDFELAAFHDLVSLSGSLVIGLAVMAKHDTPEALWFVSRVDEIWQSEQWGQDEEAEIASQIKQAAFFNAAIFARKCNIRAS